MHRSSARLLLSATWFVAPLVASAAPIVLPPDVNWNSPYRLAFVTSTTRDATSANIADYNAFVTNVANSIPELAALDATWTAIASTPTIDARDNTGTNPSSSGVAIYRLDGARVADGNVELWSTDTLFPGNRLQAAISIDESGTDPSFVEVWTGTHPDGVANEPLGGGSGRGLVGDSFWFLRDARWTNSFSDPNLSNQYHLYAISEIITMVPEPDSLILACAATAGLLIFARARSTIQ